MPTLIQGVSISGEVRQARPYDQELKDRAGNVNGTRKCVAITVLYEEGLVTELHKLTLPLEACTEVPEPGDYVKVSGSVEKYEDRVYFKAAALAVEHGAIVGGLSSLTSSSATAVGAGPIASANGATKTAVAAGRS